MPVETGLNERFYAEDSAGTATGGQQRPPCPLELVSWSPNVAHNRVFDHRNAVFAFGALPFILTPSARFSY